MVEKIEALVEGGKATPGPPLGPALGPLGVNIMTIIGDINERTKEFDGMKVPVVVKIDPKTKEYEISVGTPPTSALILEQLGIESGSSEQRETYVGDITVEQIKKVVRMKGDSLLGVDMTDRAMEVMGTCTSMGVTVEGMRANKFQAEVKAGRRSIE